MSTPDVWNARYRSAERPPDQPDPFLVASRESFELLPRRPEDSNALDIACGAGRHALWLAGRGFRTLGVDRSEVALEIARERAAAAGLSIDFRAGDVEALGYELPAASFDLIAVFYFLHRPLLPALAAALRPGGLLVYKTFTRDRTAPGGPRRPEHLLRPDELLAAFAQMRVIRYEKDAQAGLAALLAQRLS